MTNDGQRLGAGANGIAAGDNAETSVRVKGSLGRLVLDVNKRDAPGASLF